MINAGKLDRNIDIQRKCAKTVSPTGAPVDTWRTIATVRAEVVTQSASEFLTGFGEAESSSVVFRIRWLNSWPDGPITTAHRVLYNDTVHNLTRVVEIGRRRGLELHSVATS